MLYKKIFIAALFLAVSAHAENKKNKIIFQVSPARCLATAALRMWEARGDFVVMNEPMMYAYVLENQPERPPAQLGACSAYDQFIEQILTIAQENSVFIKEESSVMLDCLLRNPSILTDERVHFIFVIRNPHHAVISFYNRHKQIINNFVYFVGFKPCYDVLQMVCQQCMNPPILVQAEDLYNRPLQTAQKLCSDLHIPFMQNMLEWQSLGDNFFGSTWFDLKDQPTLYHWHADAIKSTSFHKPTSYEVDLHGKPTFSEINNPEHKIECIKAYEFNMLFYDRIKSHFPTTQQ